MTEFLALAIAAFAVDGLVWGFAGFFVFRLLGGGKRWWVGILATVVLSLAEEALVFLPLVTSLDLRIGNEEVSDLLGTDRLANLVTFDPFSDVLITVFAIAVGFLLAGFLDDRRASRAGVARAGQPG
jgi:ABC-type spermidine/putrescine transport system permease subunit II